MNVRLWQSRREAVVDVLVVLVTTGLTALIYLASPPGTFGPGSPWPVFLVAELPFLLVLLVRRRGPLAVLAFVIAGSVLVGLLVELAPGPALPTSFREETWVPVAAAVATYSAVVYATRRVRAWVMIAFLVLIATRPWEVLTTPAIAGQVAIGGVLFTAVPALLGLYVGARRRLLHSLAERAERAEREQHLVAAQARAAERAQLAAEMHDVVTHRVSLIVLQAGALGITTTDEQTRRVAEDLRVAGCQALEELRDLVGVLCTDPGADADPEDGSERASLPDLAGLVAASGSAGVPVELVEAGDPELASPVVGRTAYRIVREALTNVHKHAPGATTRVDVRYAADGVRLTVGNAVPLQRPDSDLTASGAGAGLEMLRQRVELVHGTLRAGPRADGGFCVHAELPAYVPTSTGARDEF